jgi:hypothetical protein
VIAKFNTNFMEKDAIDSLEQVVVDIKYHTENYRGEQFIQELNYVHYSMLVCNLEHQLPFIFNVMARETLMNNLDNMGNLSFSLKGSGQLMIKLMRTIERQALSLSEELVTLSQTSKRKKATKSKTYPIQFFNTIALGEQ